MEVYDLSLSPYLSLCLLNASKIFKFFHLDPINTNRASTYQEYVGRFLRVNFPDKPKPKEPLYPETEHKLFVGNLSWSVTSESLKQVFQEYGNVVGARVLFNGETGRSRGYGFVSYSTKTEMENSIESLNGMVPICSLSLSLIYISQGHICSHVSMLWQLHVLINGGHI